MSYDAAASRVSFEPLEDRRLFNTVTQVFVDPSPVDLFGPRPEIGLPRGEIALPRPADLGLAGPGAPATSPFARDLRGSYKGGAQLAGVGGVRLRVNIDDQVGDVVAGNVRVPALGVSVSGTATVTFLRNRRFEVTLTQGSDTATIEGRVNRDRTVSGTFSVVSDGVRRDGTFAVTRQGV